MRFACLLLLLFAFLAFSPAYGQRKAKVDTVAAFEAFNEGLRLEKSAKYDSAISQYQLAAKGYEAYALSLSDKKKCAAPKKRAWKEHFSAQASIGLCLYRMGQSDSALKLLLAVKVACSRVLGDSNLVMATIVNIIGVVYKDKNEYTEALIYCTNALDILLILPINNKALADSYFITGIIYKKVGRFRDALNSFEQSLKSSKLVYEENHSNVALCYNHIGDIHINLGQYEQAIGTYQQALKIQNNFGSYIKEFAGIYNNVGVAYFNLGQYGKSLIYYQQALNVLGDQHPDVVNIYLNIANAYFYQGQYKKSLDYFQKCLTIKEEALGDQHPVLANIYVDIGNVYVNQGENDRALSNYEKALNLYNKLINKKKLSISILRNIALCTMRIGNIYKKIGKNLEAINNYKEAYKIEISIDSLGDKQSLLPDIYNSLGDLYLGHGLYKESIEFYQDALTKTINTLGKEHPQSAIIYLNMANTYEYKQNYKQALNYRSEALNIFKNTYDTTHPYVALCYNNFASTYRNQVQYPEAIDMYKKSLMAYLPNYATTGYRSLQSNSPEVLKYPLTYLPRTLQRRNAPGDDTFALATVRFADRFIDSLRRAYAYENDKLELGGNANQLYQVAIDIAQWNKLDEEAFYYSEKNKAAVLAQSLNEATALKLGGIPDSLLEKDKELRTLVAFYTKDRIDEELNCPKCDSTKLSKLKNDLFTHQQQHTDLKSRLESEFPQYFALKYKDVKISVKDVQQEFLAENPNSAILEYLLGDSVLYAFCITKDKYAFHRQKLDSTRLRDKNALQLEIQKLDSALADTNLNRAATTAVSNPASALYDYLIKPFEQQIKGKDLVIIPDTELNKIPFEMLIKPNPTLNNIEKWQELPYLIKRHNISYHYAVHLLLDGWKKGKTKLIDSSSFIGFAPVFKNTSYTHLPFTVNEVKKIDSLFKIKKLKSETYCGENANEAKLYSLVLKKFKYVHFATHGITNDVHPTQSHLVLARTPVKNTDNLLTSSEMYGLELDAELVVLSACQTGKGTLKAGEGIIGLTRGLLYSGARNLMVSQWNVNDASTAELMTKFYAKILAGQSNRQALREAKLELLNSKFACPHYWSAFVLVGR